MSIGTRFTALTVLACASATSTFAAQPAPCDRECLNAFADRYVAALVAHDPARVPLAAGVKIVENVKRIAAGEGLWKTASAAPGPFRIYVPDVVAQQVGFLAVLQADGKPVELALRLKIEGGRITEAEHLVVTNLRENTQAHFEKPRSAFASPVPDGFRDARNRLLHIGATYYDALDENNGSLAPFADDCVRFENGFQTARNTVPADRAEGRGQGVISALTCGPQLDTNAFEYITRIDNRRVWIADEDTGLALGFSHFRHAFTKKEFRVFGVPGITTRTLDFQPFDMPAAHVFKIVAGQIHEIEAVGISVPYNSASGWE
jgi:hypothetical protein